MRKLDVWFVITLGTFGWLGCELADGDAIDTQVAAAKRKPAPPPPPPPPCNVYDGTGCSAGTCFLLDSYNLDQCASAAGSPTDIGEACAFSNDCAVGLFCLGNACVKLCDASHPCGAGTCVTLFDVYGYCEVPPPPPPPIQPSSCNVYDGSGCNAGATCFLLDSYYLDHCLVQSSNPVGLDGPCYLSNDCQVGLFCLGGDGIDQGQCVEICDDTNPCAQGNCIPLFDAYDYCGEPVLPPAPPPSDPLPSDPPPPPSPSDPPASSGMCDPVVGSGCEWLAGAACFFVDFYYPARCTNAAYATQPTGGLCSMSNDCQVGHYCTGDGENPGICLKLCDANRLCPDGSCAPITDELGNPVQGMPAGLGTCPL